MKGIRRFFADFFRIWLFIFFSYLTIKVLFNLIFYGWVDLRLVALLELLILPFGQSILFWIITRVRKNESAGPS